jgi:alpha-amylase
VEVAPARQTPQGALQGWSSSVHGWMRLAGCALLLALAGCAADPSPVSKPSPSGSPSVASAPSGVLVHLFAWPWASVGRECTDHLGPAGVSGVQISPPQEHIELPDQKYPWWQDYQPVSYTIQSRRGDRAAFAAMVRDCHSAGVKVYADAVLNHMTAQLSGTGSAGTKFTLTGYPGYDGAADFHHCGHSITDWTNRTEVTNCDLLGLADLATEKPGVRARLSAYLDDLVGLGVDGFRIDAAKHIPSADLAAILGGMRKRVPVYQEVLDDPMLSREYLAEGAVLEPRYGTDLSRAMRPGGSLINLTDLGKPTGDMLDYQPSGDAVVYVDSHDTQRGGNTLSYADGYLHTLATDFMLAYPYGTPLVMSSFAFQSFDDGPPSTSDGTTKTVVCGPKAFVCEHRLVLGLVRFRSTAGDAPVSHWWTAGDQLGFAREGKGYFALNRSASPETRTVDTGLPTGSYVDRISGHPVTVDDAGRATITIPAQGALAFDVNAANDAKDKP